jgi:small subunit ribosomal protein S1
MPDLLERVEPQVQEGQAATGTIVLKKGRRPYALVDVANLKCAGILPSEELELVEDGQAVEVLVLEREGEDGLARVSVRQLLTERAWVEVARDVENKTALTFKAERTTRGGVLGTCGDLEAFLPASRSTVRRLHQLPRLVGQEFEVVVVEAERERGNIIVSQVEAVAARQEEVISGLVEGELYTLPVEGLADFGAFLDLGHGVTGLLHASELSWKAGRHNPKDYLSVGQDVTVRLIDIAESEKGPKIGFSMRRITSAWEEAATEVQAGAVVTGRVTNVKDGLGSFVSLAGYPRVVGLLRGESLTKGKNVDVRVVSFDPSKQRAKLELA